MTIHLRAKDKILGWLDQMANSHFRVRGTPGLHPGAFSVVPTGLVLPGTHTPALTSLCEN
jgi:hypothetical protein